VVLGLVMFSCLALGSTDVSPSPSPASSIAPDVQTPVVRITSEQAKRLRKEFQKAQGSELKGLEHRYKLEISELKASQSARLKEWESKERATRHEFFRTHLNGPDRRAYIQDFLKRRSALRAILKDEFNSRRREQDVRRQSLIGEQKFKANEFQGFLNKGETPPGSLWPQPGT
jgi:hypothetical protein